MNELLAEYLPILIFIAIAAGLGIAMAAASFLVARQHPDQAKLSPYECGFEPFEDARGKFDVRFYLVAILFIIFDLEVAFLFPWAITLGDEPAASGVTGRRSNQLSYTPKIRTIERFPAGRLDVLRPPWPVKQAAAQKRMPAANPRPAWRKTACRPSSPRPSSPSRP